MANGRKKAKKAKKPKNVEVQDYRRAQAKRKIIPPAKIAAEGTASTVPKAAYVTARNPAPVLIRNPVKYLDHAKRDVIARRYFASPPHARQCPNDSEAVR